MCCIPACSTFLYIYTTYILLCETKLKRVCLHVFVCGAGGTRRRICVRPPELPSRKRFFISTSVSAEGHRGGDGLALLGPAPVRRDHHNVQCLASLPMGM